MKNTQRSRIEPFLGPLFGYAYSLTSNSRLAEDLVRGCAARASSARNVPRDEAVYRTWLFRILRSAYIDRTQQNPQQNSSSDEEAGIEQWEIWRCNDSVVSGLTVKVGLEKLPPHHREIIALIDVVGFGYAEAAAFLGVPLDTIVRRLSRARRVLLRSLVDGNIRTLPLERESKRK